MFSSVKASRNAHGRHCVLYTYVVSVGTHHICVYTQNRTEQVIGMLKLNDRFVLNRNARSNSDWPHYWRLTNEGKGNFGPIGNM